MSKQVRSDPIDEDTTEERMADPAIADAPIPDTRPFEAVVPDVRPREARDADVHRPAPAAPSNAPRETPPEAELLLPPQRREDLRRTWLEIQSSFIDEPPEAVRKADGLVQELLTSLTQRFEAARRDLESEWSRGEDVSTESLRLALRRYRAIFDRLLAY
jgi:hypothetical protein